MPLLIILLLAALAIFLLVMALWIGFVLVARLLGIIIGVSVIVAGVALIVGTGIGLVFPFRVMRGKTENEPVIASASAVRSNSVFKTAPTGASRDFGWDAAWPLYAPYQLRNDQVAVIQEARRLSASIWRRSRGWWPQGTALLAVMFSTITWAIVLGIPTLGLIAGVALGTLLWLAITSVFRLVVNAAQAVSLRVMRWREARFMKRHNAAVRCTRCYQSTTMPSFRCSNPQCSIVHRDMAPGRLGIRHRICACGEQLPVTVAKASKTLVAVCPYCDEELPQGSGTRRVVVVPVFGSVGAGKTQFLASAAVALHEGSSGVSSGLSITALNPSAQEFLAASVAERAAGQAPVKTRHEQRPEGLPYLVERPEGEFELHLMDAAGENFVGADGTTQLGYLDISQSLVFLVDPLTIPEVHEELELSAMAGKIQVAQGGTSDAYASVVDRLRNSGEDLSKRQLAVVVTKADVIAEIMPATPLPDTSAGVRDWLYTHGEDRLITRLEMDFANVRYFAVSSAVESAPTASLRPMHVIDWTIMQHGGTSVFPTPAAPHGQGHQPSSGSPEKSEVGA
ncbi:hypothetical protein [Leucobacter sp. G161]|uniref:TRAFAC clade GTPase domain-containing protein n=1 Tax=Leucobacter sp. G161 TaxID=663704 RepID=UPI00073B31C5|nr:hypothetical protein [Leucobacter sp. G161]KUF06683.1 hypothetical protein AUL38_11695 [Leucobacter sp. G161]